MNENQKEALRALKKRVEARMHLTKGNIERHPDFLAREKAKSRLESYQTVVEDIDWMIGE